MTNVWAEHIARLGDSSEGRLLGVSLALAAEVMVLKAEVRRLREALHDSGGLDAQSEAAVGESASFQAWLRTEQAAFARSLLRPWLVSDEAPDVSQKG